MRWNRLYGGQFGGLPDIEMMEQPNHFEIGLVKATVAVDRRRRDDHIIGRLGNGK
jgi:hypothetical protein